VSSIHIVEQIATFEMGNNLRNPDVSLSYAFVHSYALISLLVIKELLVIGIKKSIGDWNYW